MFLFNRVEIPVQLDFVMLDTDDLTSASLEPNMRNFLRLSTLLTLRRTFTLASSTVRYSTVQNRTEQYSTVPGQPSLLEGLHVLQRDVVYHAALHPHRARGRGPGHCIQKPWFDDENV